MEGNKLQEIPVCLQCYNTEPPPLAIRCNQCGGRIDLVKPGTLIEVLRHELALVRQQVTALNSQIQWHMRHANEQREMINRVVTFLTADDEGSGPFGLSDIETLEQLKHVPEILRSLFPDGSLGRGVDALKKGTATEVSFKDGTKAIATPINLRSDVVKFALAMEERLEANDWKNNKEEYPNPIQFFIDKLGEEIDELLEAVNQNRSEGTSHGILHEAADVANIAMLIAKVTRAL